EEHLPELSQIGLDDDRLLRLVTGEYDALALGPPGKQTGGLLDHAPDLERASLEPWWSGEIEEALERALQPCHLFFEHRQIAVAQACRAGAPRRLHQQFHRHQGVAQLVG